MNKTTIEYLDYTWNPLAMLCTPISESCENCWHRKRARLLSFNPKISDLERKAYAGLIGPRLVKDRLDDPLKVKKPSIIGVQFMGDLFHLETDKKDIARIFWMMGVCDWHTYLILTKRPQEMKAFIEWYKESYLKQFEIQWPYSHVWLGVTGENQQRADERIPILLQIPAAKHFVSIEPMLGAVSLRHPAARGRSFRDWDWINKLDWVIAGGESGPGARPMHSDWVRSVRNQCQEAGVPFFFKQWGEWLSSNQRGCFRTKMVPHLDMNSRGTEPLLMDESTLTLYRVGKKQAGRLLDGQEWNEKPE